MYCFSTYWYTSTLFYMPCNWYILPVTTRKRTKRLKYLKYCPIWVGLSEVGCSSQRFICQIKHCHKTRHWFSCSRFTQLYSQEVSSARKKCCHKKYNDRGRIGTWEFFQNAIFKKGCSRAIFLSLRHFILLCSPWSYFCSLVYVVKPAGCVDILLFRQCSLTDDFTEVNPIYLNCWDRFPSK